MGRCILLLLSMFAMHTSAQNFTVSSTPADTTLVKVRLVDSSGGALQGRYDLTFRDTAARRAISYRYATDSLAFAPAQPIPAGVYNIALGASKNVLFRNVQLGPAQRHEVAGMLPYGKIRFEYRGDRAPPVKGLRASVQLRFTNDIAALQPCDEVRSYPPGSYYVEINTLPLTRFLAEVAPESETLFQLRQHGTLVIRSNKEQQKIVLYQLLSGPALRFLEATVKKDDRLDLKPGTYELRRPGEGRKGEKTKTFSVESNQVTQILLD